MRNVFFFQKILVHNKWPSKRIVSVCIAGIASLPCTSGLPPNTVFDYFVKNCLKYDLSKVEFHLSNDELGESSLQSSGSLLTFTYNTEKQPFQLLDSCRNKRDITEYGGNVVIYYKPSNDTDVITLHYYVLLINKREFYPRPQLLANISSIRRRHRTISGYESGVQTESDIGLFRIFFLLIF